MPPVCWQSDRSTGQDTAFPLFYQAVSRSFSEDLYKQVYKQRTASERINSLAVELGIERPKLRNGQAITNQNTLIYVLIELRALHRVREQKQALARQEATLPANG
jgi:hypothetical protein